MTFPEQIRDFTNEDLKVLLDENNGDIEGNLLELIQNPDKELSSESPSCFG